jgi:hypothetical protein
MANLMTTKIAPLSRVTVEVVVIHDGITQNALSTAAALAKGLDARIRLLVPHVVPYPLALENSPPVRYAADRCRLLAAETSIPIRIDVRICRDATEAIVSALPPHSIVVMAPRRFWKWHWEPALAAKLRRHGHQVIVPAHQ